MLKKFINGLRHRADGLAASWCLRFHRRRRWEVTGPRERRCTACNRTWRVRVANGLWRGERG